MANDIEFLQCLAQHLFADGPVILTTIQYASTNNRGPRRPNTLFTNHFGPIIAPTDIYDTLAKNNLCSIPVNFPAGPLATKA